MMKRILIVAVLTVCAAAFALSQNLLDNDAYKKAVQLRNEAQNALSSGQYDQAQKLSAESQVYAKQAVDIAKQMELAYRATNWLDLAKQRIAFAQSVKAANRYPSAWKTAQEQYTIAQTTYSSKEYEKSITSSQAVMTALEGVGPASVAAKKVLPEYYTVRLIPNRRDCFWRIAEYPFVYGDPLKWPLLYNANKSLLQDPNNPNLIQPGMVFKIPSINGQKRVGTYKTDNTQN